MYQGVKILPKMCTSKTSKISINSIKIDQDSQRQLFYSFLETKRVIIRLNSRYCFPIVDFQIEKVPAVVIFHRLK